MLSVGLLVTELTRQKTAGAETLACNDWSCAPPPPFPSSLHADPPPPGPFPPFPLEATPDSCPLADAEEVEDLRAFQDTKNGFSLSLPASFEMKEKAGATALFEDPDRRSTSVGVTVNPVRVPSLSAFGSLEDVGAKLLGAEKAKVGQPPPPPPFLPGGLTAGCVCRRAPWGVPSYTSRKGRQHPALSSTSMGTNWIARAGGSRCRPASQSITASSTSPTQP